jgi:RNA polymerase sigma-70 factor (ECF subfamily)
VRLTIVDDIIKQMNKPSEKEAQFLQMLNRYKDVVIKACYIYTSEKVQLGDLYQEVLINLWQGFDKFRGDAKISTWIYRTAINTCITWHRRNNKHNLLVPLDELTVEAIAEDSSKTKYLQEMYQMISCLEPLEKAIVTLWLDENSYDDIASITGLSRANVAVKLHRIKDKLVKRGNL